MMEFTVFFMYMSGCVLWTMLLIGVCFYAIRWFRSYRDSRQAKPELKWFGAKDGDEFKVDGFATYHFYEDSNDVPDNGGDIIEPHDGVGVWVKDFKRSIHPEVQNESNKVVMWRGKYLDEYSKDELIQIVSEVHMTAERERKQHEEDLEFLGI